MAMFRGLQARHVRQALLDIGYRPVMDDEAGSVWVCDGEDPVPLPAEAWITHVVTDTLYRTGSRRLRQVLLAASTAQSREELAG